MAFHGKFFNFRGNKLMYNNKKYMNSSDSSYPIQSTPKYINPNRICQLPDSFRTASNLNRQKSLTNIPAPHKQPERSTREILNRIEDHWM